MREFYIVVADTPGVLWPKIENEADGYRLAASGAIGDKAMDALQVASFAVEFLTQAYPERLRERFKLDLEPAKAPELVSPSGWRRRKVAGCDQEHVPPRIPNEPDRGSDRGIGQRGETEIGPRKKQR